MPKTLHRRRLLQVALLGGAALPVFSRLLHAADDSPPILDENDVTAKSLAYVADASKVDAAAYPNYKPGQLCSNCGLWQGEPADKLGGCELVLGQYVVGKGWCKVWEARKPKSGA
ncbi:MAG: high-potential iron-sulfur protein [Pseudomonadota bacterium]